MSRKAHVLEGCEVLSPMESPRDRARDGNATKDANKSKARRKRSAGRFGVLNAFVDFTMGNLKGADLPVWLVLWRDTKDGIARTGQTDIARRSGVTTRTVRRALLRLASLGLVQRVRRGRLGSGPSAYRVLPLVATETNRT